MSGDAHYRRDPDHPRERGWSRRDNAFPSRTCPASRHAALIADSLRDFHSPLRRLLIDAGYEPDHMASSIESTCLSVWRHRRFLRWDRDLSEWLPQEPTDER
jgi:hypothetical protein